MRVVIISDLLSLLLRKAHALGFTGRLARRIELLSSAKQGAILEHKCCLILPHGGTWTSR